MVYREMDHSDEQLHRDEAAHRINSVNKPTNGRGYAFWCVVCDKGLGRTNLPRSIHSVVWLGQHGRYNVKNRAL